jgi:hypothetical protein
VNYARILAYPQNTLSILMKIIRWMISGELKRKAGRNRRVREKILLTMRNFLNRITDISKPARF